MHPAIRLALPIASLLLAACVTTTQPPVAPPEQTIKASLKASAAPGGALLPQPDTPPVGLLPQPDTPPVGTLLPQPDTPPVPAAAGATAAAGTEPVDAQRSGVGENGATMIADEPVNPATALAPAASTAPSASPSPSPSPSPSASPKP